MNKSTKESQGWQEMFAVSSQSGRRGYKGERERFSTPIRLGIIWLVFVVFASIIGARLFYIQVLEGERSLLISEENRLEIQRDRAPRGVIYDRKGRVLVRNVEDEEYGVTREYVLGPVTSHILGYVSEVNEGELGCQGGLCYSQGMLRGRSGIEASFEEVLRGQDGGEIVEVDAGGNVVRSVGRHEPEPGQDVKLSLDLDLQRMMYEVMSSYQGEGEIVKGSAVALDMQGRVMGMVSIPSYDPNLFTVREETQVLQNLLQDEESQFFLNRAVSGRYPPGSVYKLVTAYAGLEEGAIDEDTEIEDTGEIRIGDQYRYGNWYFDQYGRTEGFLNVSDALKRSNDIFFYKVGERVGVDKLASWSERFGLGEKTGIELESEAQGLVPTPLWKERYVGEKWFLGNTYHMAIGQGDLLMTPLQVARMTAGSLSGRLCDVTVLSDSPLECSDIGLSSSSIGVVWEGMRRACATGGTAFPFFDFEPYVVCKTGTAQHGGEETLPHAWITVGYPGENPEMVLVVMLEEAGEGSAEAGSVASEILSRWKEI